jgi:APA family basic amino acid/polyamine antiporter
VRFGARTQNLLSVLKIAMIVALALTAFALAPHAASPSPASAGGALRRLSTALIPCFYAFGGYQLTMNLGADVREARTRLPRAISYGMLTVLALYLLLNVAYERVLGIEGIAASKLVAASLARAVFGSFAETVVSVMVFLSAAGFVNATIMQMPRSFLAMAQDGVLPRAFLRVNPQTQTQEVGLLFFGATMLIPALLLGSFEKLMNYVMATDTLTLAVVASTLFVLRRRATEAVGFAVPGYPVLPAVYVLMLLGVSASVFATTPLVAVSALAIQIAGWPLYVLGRRVFADRARSAPV